MRIFIKRYGYELSNTSMHKYMNKVFIEQSVTKKLDHNREYNYMYRQIIDTLNQFLNYIHIPDTPLNPDAYQGVFVKKPSRNRPAL